MKTVRIWRAAATALVSVAVGAGLAYAKLPPMDDAAKAKAEEAKAKAAESAKKAREAEEKAMDRVVERYKKEKGPKEAAAAPVAAKKQK